MAYPRKAAAKDLQMSAVYNHTLAKGQANLCSEDRSLSMPGFNLPSFGTGVIPVNRVLAAMMQRHAGVTGLAILGKQPCTWEQNTCAAQARQL